MCLAALSVEDIEDIPIRNHDNRSSADWIRLCPGLSKNSEKREQLSKASQAEDVGRAVSIETETINRNMDSIMEKLTALQKKIDDIRDQNGQRE